MYQVCTSKTFRRPYCAGPDGHNPVSKNRPSTHTHTGIDTSTGMAFPASTSFSLTVASLVLLWFYRSKGRLL